MNNTTPRFIVEGLYACYPTTVPVTLCDPAVSVTRQIKEESMVEDLNNILNAGEVPNLFALEDKIEICEKMRVIDRQRDKSMQVGCALGRCVAVTGDLGDGLN